MSITPALAARLVTLGAAVLEAAPRSKAFATAVDRLDGACEALDALGLTMTPTGARMAVTDALASVGPRPAATADNVPRKAWQVRAVEAVQRHVALNARPIVPPA